MTLHDVHITASWYPPTAQGSLIATDTPRDHIGGIVTMGRGGFQKTVAIDEPTRFTVRAEGHDDLTLTLDPRMTSAAISEGSRMLPFPASFEVSFHYPTLAEAWEKMPMNFIPQRAPTVYSRPSGYPLGQTVATPPQNEHAAASPAVRYYQRILLGKGFTVGTKGADGILGPETSRGIEAFKRWYNDYPADSGRADAPMLPVDRSLSPATQLVLQRFESTASDVLGTRTSTTIVQPALPATPAVREFPWLALGGAALGAVALVAFLSYAESHQKRRPAGA